MFASAALAVLLGVAAVLVFKLRHPSPPLPGTDRTPDVVAKQTERAEQPAPAAAATDRPTSPAAPAAGQPAPAPPPPAAGQPAPPLPAGQTDRNAPPPAPERAEAGSDESAVPVAAAAPPSPPERECFANVSSKPVGAEIVLDQKLIGKTPKRVALPCGNPIDLVIRKPRLVPATRTITPTPGKVTTVKVTLAREASTVKRPTSPIRKPTSAVKVIVISTPDGAAVTLNGEPVGVTPTTVKVPASGRSTLSIAKDGYETETKRILPRSSGITVRAELKKLEGNRPPI